MKLTDQQISEYEINGFLVQEKALNEESIEKLLFSTRAFQFQTHPGHVLEKDGKTFRAFHGCHLYDESYRDLIRNPQFLMPAQQLLKDDVYIHQLKVNVKQAFSGEMWPWHQDYIYWRNEDHIPTANMVSVMIFLDDINAFNGPLFFIPGSHQVGCINSPKALDAPEGWKGNVSATLTYQIDNTLVTRLVEQGGLFSATGKKGTAVWFHGNLIHASPPNISPLNRRIAILTYNATSNIPVTQPHPIRPEFLNGRDYRPLVSLRARTTAVTAE
jgi:ectoine hydroxylase-related dioxygenase (phytanoyl-CoA dioxygenase family)